MRIGLLTQYYAPETGPAALPAALAVGLRARGHDVHVVTGFPNYPTGTVASGYRVQPRLDETLDGVSVRRVALYPTHDASFARRAANHASFGASAALLSGDVLADCDALWVNYSPALALPMWTARVRRGVPSLLHTLDLWPDTLRASNFSRPGPAFRVAERALHRWCAWMYRSASSVAYISPGAGEALAARGVPRSKLAYIPMWADEAIYRPDPQPRPTKLRKELGIADDAVVLLYAGALGNAQGLHTLVEACASVRSPRFVAIVVGSGVCEDALHDRARMLGVPNLRFLGRVSQDRIREVHAAADVEYVSLRSHPFSDMSTPSKTQTAMAVGRPLLAAADGDVRNLVTEEEIGLVADPRSPDDIARAIDRLCAMRPDELRAMGTRARAVYDRQFSLTTGVARVESLLQSAAAGDAGVGSRVRADTIAP